MTPRTIVATDFFSEVFQELHALPLIGFGIAALIGVLSLGSDIAFRALDAIHPMLANVMGGLFVLTWFLAYFSVTMISAKVKVSWRGGIKFGSSVLANVGVPLGLLFGGIWLTRFSDGAGVLILSAAALYLMIVMPMLSGWPLAQTVGQGLVSPLRVLKASKGHRWGLFAASYLSTAINKIFPATDTAKSFKQAMLLGVGNGAVTAASLLILAIVASTAWKFACQNDPTLCEESNTCIVPE
ncbi:hypothetical protein GRI58_12325 [Porphyrobacter algicida]|uniref:Uncharacterized protein n=1 Tax=Qipengyuania algicida TaxID=1836209 RepID=A0A845AKC4_9SPHN|nr:hypothetical protein [Qipengyuania algicida]MXP29603.1 hypothetical protein [Qipengyuania algicida]